MKRKFLETLNALKFYAGFNRYIPCDDKIQECMEELQKHQNRMGVWDYTIGLTLGAILGLVIGFNF